MSNLVFKEIRLLLPFWGIALVLAVVPVWLFPRESFVPEVNSFVYWAVGFGLILVGMAPFGQEFSLGTFPSLLAQPLERERIWRTKITLVCIAAVLIVLALVFSVNLRLDGMLSEAVRNLERHVGDYWDGRIKEAAKDWSSMAIWRSAFELLLVGIPGGLWATLLFRQTGAALWFAILIPGFLLVILQGVFQAFSIPAGAAIESTTLLVLLVAYAVLGYLWAQRMFLRAQDAQWLGETISLLGLNVTKEEANAPAAARSKKPVRTLLKREIQSHQISLFIAFGLLVFHACTLFVRKFHQFQSNSEMHFALEAVPFLWFLVPWLVGSVAVAEERKLGTLESQLCLPVARRTQFAMKLGIVVLLGIVLGGLMPVLIELLGSALGVTSDLAKGKFDFTTSQVFIVAGGVIAFIAFFASTLTRNTLAALGVSIVFGIASWALIMWVDSESTRYDYSLWKGPLIFIICVPVLVIVLIGLGFKNYKMLQIGRNVWFRNLVVLAVSLFLAGTATAFVYQRPWELLMTLEPRHGTSRLGGSIRPVICMPQGRPFILLPDGRLWAADSFSWKEFRKYNDMWEPEAGVMKIPTPNGGVFVGGSNWVSLVSANTGVIALESDGTLWRILSTHVDGTNNLSRRFFFSLHPEMRRVTADNDWAAIGMGGGCFLAVKTNGTLWGWGFNEDGQFPEDPRKYVEEPQRIGTNSDWQHIFSERNDALLMKRGGDLWTWSKVISKQRYEFEPTYMNSQDWVAVAGGAHSLVLHRDGSLWAWGYLPRVLFGVRTSRNGFENMTRIGRDTEWSQISGEGRTFVATKKNGALIKSDSELFSSVLGQPSKYSDWLAVNSDYEAMVALASDGTVSFWSEQDYWQLHILLSPTHAPQWSLNIFSDSKN